MTARRISLGVLVVLLSAASCSKNNATYLVVEVERGVAVGQVGRIELQIDFAGRTADHVWGVAGRTLALPVTGAFRIADGEGGVVVRAVALDSGGAELGRGSAVGTVIAHEAVTVRVLLGTSDLPDGGLPDGGGDGGLPDAAVDDAAVPDAATPDATLADAATPGVLDPSFATAGVFTQQLLGGPSRATGIARQTDGKLLVSGWAGVGAKVVLMRLHPNGTLDTGFGTSGIVIRTENTSSSVKVAVRPNGRIVLAWTGAQPLALQLLSDGTPDNTWNSGGLAVGPYMTYLLSLNVTANDVILGGNIYDAADGNHTYAQRFALNGTADNTFGTSSTLRGPAFVYFSALVRQPGDGKFLLAANTAQDGSSNLLLQRYDPDGQLDRVFGSNGNVNHNGGNTDFAYAGTLQGDGKLALAGATGLFNLQQLTLWRFDANGVLDPGFGSGGIAAMNLGTDTSGAWAIAQAADAAKLIVGVRTDNQSPAAVRFMVARYLTGGTLDNSFGSAGMVSDFGIPASTAQSLVDLQPTSAGIVVVGSRGSGVPETLTVLRLLH